MRGFARAKADLKAAVLNAESAAMESLLGFLPAQHPWCVVYRGDLSLEAIEGALKELKMLDSLVGNNVFFWGHQREADVVEQVCIFKVCFAAVSLARFVT